MTWTCAKCQNVNRDGECKCLRDGCDGAPWKPAGLSEEERAAWSVHCDATDEHYPVESSTPKGRAFSVAFYRAARAPLEAENAKLREHVRELEAQLAQAQKPAAPAGLPEVGTLVEIEVAPGKLVADAVAAYEEDPGCGQICKSTGPCFYTENWAGHYHSDQEGKRWRRIPPAQTSREPAVITLECTCYKHSAPGTAGTRQVRPGCQMHCPLPTAPPPGEVSTPNTLEAADKLFCNAAEKPMLLRAVETDIRAALAEVERLRGELERAKAPKRCPADGMSDAEPGEKFGAPGVGLITVGQKILDSLVRSARANNIVLESMGRTARELFTPIAPAQPERKMQVGDTVWTFRESSGRYGGPYEAATVVDIRGVGSKGGVPMLKLKFADGTIALRQVYFAIGRDWWWDDPSAKGEG